MKSQSYISWNEFNDLLNSDVVYGPSASGGGSVFDQDLSKISML